MERRLFFSLGILMDNNLILYDLSHLILGILQILLAIYLLTLFLLKKPGSFSKVMIKIISYTRWAFATPKEKRMFWVVFFVICGILTILDSFGKFQFIRNRNKSAQYIIDTKIFSDWHVYVPVMACVILVIYLFAGYIRRKNNQGGAIQ